MDRLKLMWECISQDSALALILISITLLTIILLGSITWIKNKIPYRIRSTISDTTSTWTFRLIGVPIVFVLLVGCAGGLLYLIWFLGYGIYEGVTCFYKAG